MTSLLTRTDRPLANRWPLRALAAWLLASTACSSSAPDAQPVCGAVAPDQREACLSDHYFAGAAPLKANLCTVAGASMGTIGKRQEVAFFQSLAITDADVVTEGNFLQGFYKPYDLTFFTRSASTGVAFSHAMGGTNEEFLAVQRELGITSEDVTEEQRAALNKAVADILFRDLRSFVAGQSNPPGTRVNVVVLEHIASPDVAKAFSSGVIGGLGLSPVLFKNIAENDPSKNLFDVLALPSEFTPTLFIGHSDIVSLAKNPAQVVAHEMGHALGLEHTDDPGGLMARYEGMVDCQAVLTDAEVEQLRAAASRLEAGDSAMVEGARALADAHHRIVADLLRR